MQQVGKLQGQVLMATGVSGLLPTHLFYIIDSNHNYRFLVDTGTEVSVLPPSPADRKHQDGFNLLAVNGSGIATSGGGEGGARGAARGAAAPVKKNYGGA